VVGAGPGVPAPDLAWTTVSWALSAWEAAVALAQRADSFSIEHEELGSMDLLEVVRIRAHDVTHHTADVEGILAGATDE
jgi:hypothetical protein